MSILLSNKLLEAAEQKIESSLTPENRADYMKIVVAGLKTGLANGPRGILASLKQSKNPINDSAIGAINLVLLMRKHSMGTMPLKAMIPAAMTLMLQALDFADKAGIVKIGTDELVQATHIFANALFPRLGIKPQMLHAAIQRVHAISQDPAKMELVNRKLGAVKDPRASEPTPMPGGENGAA